MKLQARKPYFTAISAGLFLVAIAVAPSPAASQDSGAGANVYKSNCATCHGPDGGGTAVGKSLKAADLRSAEVQSKSDGDLIQTISDGKGNMPGFKAALSDEEIHAVLGQVRTLGAKSGSAPKKK